jgi:ParB-like chromosome segregation protein Spo0J
MIENVIRSDMDPMEDARGYRRLLDSGLTVETMSERIGKSPSAIRARLRLLELHPIAADLVAKGHLDAWTAGHIARLGSESQFKVLRAMREGLLPKGDMNAVERLCTALAAADAQRPLLDDAGLLSGGSYTELAAVPLPDPARRAARELDAHIASTLAALERLAELLEAGVEPDAGPRDLGETAVRFAKLSGRVTKTLHTQAAARLAADL